MNKCRRSLFNKAQYIIEYQRSIFKKIYFKYNYYENDEILN